MYYLLFSVKCQKYSLNSWSNSVENSLNLSSCFWLRWVKNPLIVFGVFKHYKQVCGNNFEFLRFLILSSRIISVLSASNLVEISFHVSWGSTSCGTGEGESILRSCLLTLKCRLSICCWILSGISVLLVKGKVSAKPMQSPDRKIAELSFLLKRNFKHF